MSGEDGRLELTEPPVLGLMEEGTFVLLSRLDQNKWRVPTHSAWCGSRRNIDQTARSSQDPMESPEKGVCLAHLRLTKEAGEVQPAEPVGQERGTRGHPTGEPGSTD